MRRKPDHGVGDVVTWIPGKEYSISMPEKGPFVVTAIHPGEEYCTAIKDLRTGKSVARGCSAYFSWRFQKNEFLTAARKAIHVE